MIFHLRSKITVNIFYIMILVPVSLLGNIKVEKTLHLIEQDMVTAKAELNHTIVVTKNIEDLLASYFGLCQIHIIEDQFDSAQVILDKLPHLMENISDLSFTFYHSFLQGEVYWNQNRLNEAVEFAEKAKDTARDSLKIAKVWLLEGCIASSQGDYETTISRLQEASKHFIIHGDIVSLARAYNNLANGLYNNEQYDQAAYYFERAIEISEKEEHYNKLLIYYSNLAMTYYKLGNEQKSEDMFIKTIAVSDSLDLPYHLAQNYSNYGILLSESGRYDEAEICFLRSLEISRKNQIFAGEATNCLNISAHYIKTGKLHEALTYNLLADSLLRGKDLPEYQMEIFNNYYEIYLKMGDSAKALYYLECYHTLKDSLHCLEKSDRIAEIGEKFKQWENNDRIDKINNTNRVIYTLIICIILAGLLLMIFIILITLRIKEMFHTLSRIEQNKIQKIEEDPVIEKTEEKQVKNDEEDDENNPGSQLNQMLKQALYDNVEFIWLDFEGKFKAAFPEFMSKIYGICSDITPSELQICMLARMAMSNKEIAYLTRKSARTVEKMRMNIRKKLDLQKNINLTSFLQSL